MAMKTISRSALLAKKGSSATIYTLAVGADFDEDKLRELATSPQIMFRLIILKRSSIPSVTSEDFKQHYRGHCYRRLYACRFGRPSMTIRIVMDDAVVERRVMYPTAQLTGSQPRVTRFSYRGL